MHVSSTAVYGIPDHHPLLEDDPLHGVGPYGEAKVEAEALCVGYRGKGLCVPILRPKTFVGPERLGIWAILYDWAYSGSGFPLIGSGETVPVTGGKLALGTWQQLVLIDFDDRARDRTVVVQVVS